MTKPKKTPKQLAEEHWLWLEPLLHYLYVTAFIHGAKHERKDRDD